MKVFLDTNIFMDIPSAESNLSGYEIYLML